MTDASATEASATAGSRKRPLRLRSARMPPIALVCGLLALAPFAAQAQTRPPAAASAPAGKPQAAPKAVGGPAWSQLKPAEQAALRPLQGDWTSIDELRKSKWLKIAERYPAMSPADQARLHDRMREWAKLSTEERSKVRLQFLEAKRIPATDRQAGWEAYQALSPGERKALAERAERAAPASRAASQTAASAAPAPPKARTRARDAAPAKLAAAPAPAPAPAKPVAPTVVQGSPGATTRLITQRPAPASSPAGATAKIAASSDVVDKQTLLPRAGAQKAGAQPAPPGAAGTAAAAPPSTGSRPAAASAPSAQK